MNIHSYKRRLIQLNNGFKEIYEGEKELIKEIILKHEEVKSKAEKIG